MTILENLVLKIRLIHFLLTPAFLFLQGNRDENQNVNHQLAQEDAPASTRLVKGDSRTDESCFNMVLATSFPQLKATMEPYSGYELFF